MVSFWNQNTLLLSDVYKVGHLLQYAPGTTEVYSYLEARKRDTETVFFGLQYLLHEYLTRPVTQENAEEFFYYHEQIIGPVPQETRDKINALVVLGFWPLAIKAVPEGTLVPTQNVLMTIRNTIPGFHWCVGFLESMLLKVWNPCTVATCSLKYKRLVEKYAALTCDNDSHLPFAVHDFGYRGVSSEETAMIAGGAHLLNFLGSDTILANKFLNTYYPRIKPETVISLSVPASEHSVMCSYGRENEIEAFRHMLKTYPDGIVSIVSDTYDLWNVLENFFEELKPDILNREGRVVCRPDSGDPVKIICGDPDAAEGSAEYKGVLTLLEEKLGSTLNSNGYKVLNPKIGAIYGDAMFYERFEQMLSCMQAKGFASSNLVIGVGGILLQQHSRDEYGFALKATRTIRDGQEIEIYKEPITDPGKKSKKGFMALMKDGNGKFYTADRLSKTAEAAGFLKLVFLDGKMVRTYSLEEVRENLEGSSR